MFLIFDNASACSVSVMVECKTGILVVVVQKIVLYVYLEPAWRNYCTMCMDIIIIV